MKKQPTYLIFHAYSDQDTGGIQTMIRLYAEEAHKNGATFIVLSDHRDVLASGEQQLEHLTLLPLTWPSLLKCIFTPTRQALCTFDPHNPYLIRMGLFKLLRPDTVTSLFFLGSTADTEGLLKSILLYLSPLFTNHFLALSDCVKQIAFKGKRQHRIQLCHNPVDTALYQPSALSGKQLVNADRVVAGKNHVEMIQVFILAHAQDPELTLVIAGNYKKTSNPNENTESYKQCQELLKEAGLENQVTFTGNLSPTELRNLLTSSDIFLKTSLSETCGISTIEAMASGLPVIAFDNTGTHETVSRGNGILVRDHDVEQMAHAIIQLMRNRRSIEDMGLASLQGAVFYNRPRCINVFFSTISSKIPSL